MIPVMDWIAIPRGSVTLENHDSRHPPTVVGVEAFAMARYPVTNALYAAFMEAGGYADRAWWAEEAWTAREKYRWTESRYGRDREWSQPDHPVVGVSWYEAMAFCRWLSHATGQTITLPTEEQWQRAAQGDDTREYPWGDEPPTERLCNWNRTIDHTTAVAHYPAGASPYGVMDMSGNMWEWCLTRWAEASAESAISANQANQYVLRGGCWSSDSLLCLRAANRSQRDPNTRRKAQDRDAIYGFRCIRLSA